MKRSVTKRLAAARDAVERSHQAGAATQETGLAVVLVRPIALYGFTRLAVCPQHRFRLPVSHTLPETRELRDAVSALIEAIERLEKRR